VAGERLAVPGRHVIDSYRLARTLRHGLGDLVDIALGVELILDLLVSYGRARHGHEPLAVADELGEVAEHTSFEHHVAVEPQDAPSADHLEGPQEAGRRVGVFEGLVVDEGCPTGGGME
jgi:hypothetical protein